MSIRVTVFGVEAVNIVGETLGRCRTSGGEKTQQIASLTTYLSTIPTNWREVSALLTSG